MVRVLEHAGYETAQAHNPGEAMDVLAAGPRFDAVLVDFASGGPSESIKLLDEIRRTPAMQDLAVIISSRVEKNRLFAWESGVDAFLVRPYHVDELLAELAAVLARSPEARAAHRAERLAEASA
jgi:DNA-binding response OmpR family regulator